MSSFEEVFGSLEFWAGAVALTFFQYAKFSEIDGQNDDLREWVGVLPSMKATDFIGHKLYVGALALFLLVTFLGYALVCLASPSLISGWIRATQESATAQSIEEAITSTPYPLYVAAVFMGLAHKSIPGVERIVNKQRDVFHEFVGIPKTVVDISTQFTLQVLGRTRSPEEKVDFIANLTSDEWVTKISAYADVAFYRGEISRLKLDDSELQDISRSSPRELKLSVEQLVCLASMATVRKSGGSGLKKLADSLGLKVASPADRPWKPIFSALFVSLVLIIFTSFAIPMAHQAVQEALGFSFWLILNTGVIFHPIQ